ncbi:NAD(P)/FAD-dependent oxidoreductase [Ralstonia pseudosolanacearum]|uniref:NAD(P)/FAD-dependent oxidoreductase n=1 Tax=Ralstonia solanacearum TaxID=305 RepID=A0A0S4WYV8_RALSL|nr:MULTISPECIES: NAD(P)/FAD-dependent oxidoreductase [Ralstonia]QWQ14155.1 NAD(P)/FAD-dependent oxidoreductase [Ralstonia solanacearum]MBX9428694.1 NAD(P)/FAD-dependent oxidoreductase [Ralstonia pseudosolanacearum]UZF17950.1 NAD(P)/FAD-dependent oxidoreductase [Ralstonia solanacearum]UZF27584.1 NAD(P)/FAD-dependent oxidoreductase [Ralstonia sp. RS642]UZF32716.1 NAD(P)/FAD-dependent oxidoreductase [Ralstonia sp. RS650]
MIKKQDPLNHPESVDVAIIGAGPAGAVAAALLRQAGQQVLVLERQHFPRFSIGESLLPQSMAYLEQAGMLRAVVEAGFQYKNGAYFVHGDKTAAFDFRDKHSDGWGTTYQVERAAFDQILINCAADQGADVRFGHSVRAVQPGDAPVLEVQTESGDTYTVHARFILDTSGFGRVLPRLLNLEAPTGMPLRAALFTHVQDALPAGMTDRNKICIAVHPERRDVWYWMIPLANGRSSVGCVAEASFLDIPEAEREAALRALIRTEPNIASLIGDAPFLMPVRHIGGYAANVEKLHGPGYALLGNAGEFLDPVFSSGVTIALRSADLAVRALLRQLAGETVDWQSVYDVPLRRGIDTFRAFIERWYTGELQDIIFHPQQAPGIRRMISAILAGYAWDETNPFVADPVRRLNTLHEVCRLEAV